MTKAEEFEQAFQDIKQMLEKFAPELVISTSNDKDYHLNTRHLQPNKQPLYFAGVRKNKSYVSFYLMPLYACSELAKSVSEALSARKQGKSCFNFQRMDSQTLLELSKLTTAGFAAFKAQGWI